MSDAAAAPVLIDKPVVAVAHPIETPVEAGKDYYWCTCGLSKNQPFCDASHRGRSTLKPAKVSFEKSENVWFCGCKQTKNAQGLCDGSHNELEEVVAAKAAAAKAAQKKKVLTALGITASVIAVVAGGYYYLNKKKN